MKVLVKITDLSVFQVLCSACYLQIPYVVEKCQEFITTHGHVTSPASLSEVAAPILQGLQNNGFPKLPANQVHVAFLFKNVINTDDSEARYIYENDRFLKVILCPIVNG